VFLFGLNHKEKHNVDFILELPSEPGTYLGVYTPFSKGIQNQPELSSMAFTQHWISL